MQSTTQEKKDLISPRKYHKTKTTIKNTVFNQLRKTNFNPHKTIQN